MRRKRLKARAMNWAQRNVERSVSRIIQKGRLEILLRSMQLEMQKLRGIYNEMGKMGNKSCAWQE